MPENKYTWNNIIINPHDKKAEGAIGRECYFDNNPGNVLGRANHEDTVNLLPLKEIEPDSSHPFIFDGIEGPVAFSCIVVKKKMPYSERAKNWVRENNLKVGDYVKVIRRAKDYEDGWDGRWVEEMDDFVGKVIPVSGIGKATGEIISYCYCDWAGYGFPYFVLEKVTSSEAKTIPFKDSDEFLGHYGSSLENPKETLDYFYRFLDGMWIREKYTKTLHQVVSIGENGVYIGSVNDMEDWGSLYRDFEFLDGSPCGRKVKDV